MTPLCPLPSTVLGHALGGGGSSKRWMDGRKCVPFHKCGDTSVSLSTPELSTSKNQRMELAFFVVLLLPAHSFIFHEPLIDFFVISVSSGMLILRRDQHGCMRAGLHESLRSAIDP